MSDTTVTRATSAPEPASFGPSRQAATPVALPQRSPEPRPVRRRPPRDRGRPASRQRRTFRRWAPTAELFALALVDLLSVVVVIKLALLLRGEVLPVVYSGFPRMFGFRQLTDVWWMFPAFAFFFAQGGLYTRRQSLWDEVGATVKATFLAAVTVLAVTSVGKLGGSVSRTLVVLTWALAMPTVPLIRATAKRLLRRIGLFRHPILILGAGRTGRLIAQALRHEPNYGYEVVGFLDDDPQKIGTVIHGVRVHRGVDKADRYVRRCHVADLVLAMPGAGRERRTELIDHLQHRVKNLLLVPNTLGTAVLGTTLVSFFAEQAFALKVKNNLANPVNYMMKRAFDWTCGLILLVVFAPVLVGIAVLIRLTSKGPALYAHPRVGHEGRPFNCYKFRTMRPDAELRLAEILRNDASAKWEWATHRKLSLDPRVTKLGAWLRETSLDELPQLLNVLKGDMSLVGPRPVMQEEIDKYYKEMAELCFGVLPGITGLWQVSGRSNTGYERRIALDAWYVRNWNLWLDVVLLCKTLGVVLGKRGAG